MVRPDIHFLSRLKLTPIFLSFLFVFITSDLDSHNPEGLNAPSAPITRYRLIEEVDWAGDTVRCAVLFPVSINTNTDLCFPLFPLSLQTWIVDLLKALIAPWHRSSATDLLKGSRGLG